MPLHPKDRSHFIDFAQKGLFEVEQLRLNRLLENLIRANGKLTGRFYGFTYHSRIVNHPNKEVAKAGRSEKREPIHSTLHEDAGELLRARDQLDDDRKRLVNFLGFHLTLCSDWVQVRNHLPEVVVKAVPMDQIQRLPRTQEEGYLLGDHPGQRESFQKTLDILYTYTPEYQRLFGPQSGILKV